MATLTALVVARDEEQEIEPCMKSLVFADQLLLVDTGSRDRTAQLARELGAEVVQAPSSHYGEGCNLGLEQARDTGRMAATERITLVQETGNQLGILVFLVLQWYAWVRACCGRPATWKGRAYVAATPPA